MAPSSLAQWFAAGGTVAAVILALFKDADGQGNVLWTGGCYYVRVKVENTGRTRAEKVQVGAINLAKRGLDLKFNDIQTILPLNMKWANRPPTGAVGVLDGIPPTMSAFCDIMSLCITANPHQRKPTFTPANTTVGQLQLEVDLFAE